MTDRPYEFIFSFRSPYAWMAAARVIPRLKSDIEVKWKPFFPLPAFDNFGPALEVKSKYIIRDVIRLTRAYGLTLEFPMASDPDWAVPHSAFERADELGRGTEFALELFAARWSRGELLGDLGVIESAAVAVDLDGQEIVAAAQDRARHTSLVERIQSDFDERGIFGVPTLITPDKQRYWGHDRIEWALREGLLPS